MIARLRAPLIALSLFAVPFAPLACKSKSDAAPPPAPSASASALASASASASAPASASALASAGPPYIAPDFRTFPGTDAGARALVSEFLKPGAIPVLLSKQLRPTSADYKTVFDPASAAKIDTLYSKSWDQGAFVVLPGPGQKEVQLASATATDLKDGTPKSKDLPGPYKKLASHLLGNTTIYRFKFVEPGKDEGNAYDGLMYVNGHWVLIPKAWRGLDEQR